MTTKVEAGFFNFDKYNTANTRMLTLWSSGVGCLRAIFFPTESLVIIILISMTGNTQIGHLSERSDLKTFVHNTDTNLNPV